ncbi:hypothetical protein ACFWXH_17325 [Mesorhizobium sp. NPDC059054]|uniref:hypothetical protein n=1 Tax=unclassified Mesorhizobium TaxID=325217 RepID=UPI0006C747BC|nr:hypothetical protein [Mesorhizobium sp. 1M-11]
MSIDRDWADIRPQRSLGKIGMGVLRVTLLFGSAAVALSILGASYLDSRLGQRFASADPQAGLDMMSTGSIGRTSTYTVRRSVLQASPDAVCVIRDNGTRSGAC